MKESSYQYRGCLLEAGQSRIEGKEAEALSNIVQSYPRTFQNPQGRGIFCSLSMSG